MGRCSVDLSLEFGWSCFLRGCLQRLGQRGRGEAGGEGGGEEAYRIGASIMPWQQVLVKQWQCGCAGSSRWR